MSVTLWLLASAWLLFALGWFVLHGWIVPRIGEFRPRLEIAAGKALGVPIRIGQITARSEGVFPLFELTDVRLLDAGGQVALLLPRISGVLTPASLWGLGFEQLLIEQPELDVRRSPDGKIYVGGLPVSERKDTGDDTAVDWIFSQAELVIRGGTVRWTDELRQAPPLSLTNVDWVLRNARHRHAVRLDATPPAELGERFTLRGIFRQPLLSTRDGDFSSWSGQMYGEVTRTDLARITQYADFQKLGITLTSGNGALRAWADVKDGQLIGGLADVALQGVDARLGSQLDALAFESVSGRIGGARHVDGFNFNTENLRFRTRDGLQWPGGNMALVQHQPRRAARRTHRTDGRQTGPGRAGANCQPAACGQRNAFADSIVCTQRPGRNSQGALAGPAGVAADLRRERAGVGLESGRRAAWLRRPGPKQTRNTRPARAERRHD